MPKVKRLKKSDLSIIFSVGSIPSCKKKLQGGKKFTAGSGLSCDNEKDTSENENALCENEKSSGKNLKESGKRKCIGDQR